MASKKPNRRTERPVAVPRLPLSEQLGELAQEAERDSLVQKLSATQRMIETHAREVGEWKRRALAAETELDANDAKRVGPRVPGARSGVDAQALQAVGEGGARPGRPPEEGVSIRCYACRAALDESKLRHRVGVGWSCADKQACSLRRTAPQSYREDMRRIGEALGMHADVCDVGHILGQIDEMRTGSASPTAVEWAGLAGTRAGDVELLRRMLDRIVSHHDNCHSTSCSAFESGVDDADLADEDVTYDCDMIDLRNEARALLAATPCARIVPDPLAAAATEADKIREELGVSELEREEAAHDASKAYEPHAYDCMRLDCEACSTIADGAKVKVPSRSTPSSSSDQDRASAFYEECWDSLRGRWTVERLAVLLAAVRREEGERIAQSCEREARGLEETHATTEVPDPETLLYIARRIRRTAPFTSPAKEEP